MLVPEIRSALSGPDWMIVSLRGIADQVIRKIVTRLPRSLEAVILVGSELVQERKKFSGFYEESIRL
jgi:hypothetical protein